MRNRAAVIFFAALVPFPAFASSTWPPTVKDIKQCKGNPSVVAPCFAVHGRMFLANGAPGLRIWHIGTKRILGVLTNDHPIIPPGIRKHLAFGVQVYADYQVCPFTTSKPGWMQYVCVQSASHVVLQDYRDERKKPKITVLRGTYTLAPNSSSKRTR